MVTSHTCPAALTNDTAPSGGNIFETNGCAERPPSPQPRDGGCATLLVRASADALGAGPRDSRAPNVQPAPKSIGSTASAAATGSLSASPVGSSSGSASAAGSSAAGSGSAAGSSAASSSDSGSSARQ